MNSNTNELTIGWFKERYNKYNEGRKDYYNDYQGISNRKLNTIRIKRSINNFINNRKEENIYGRDGKNC